MVQIYFYLIVSFFIIQLITVPDINSVVTANQSSSSCSPLNSTEEPKVKTVNNKNCFFPFNFKNQIYDDCISYGINSKFCPTSCNLEADNEMSLCRWEKKNLLEPSCANITSARQSKEPLTISNGSCVFPFVYKGRCYNDCILLDARQPWCAATESLDLNPSQFHICYYNRSVIDQKSCANLSTARPYFHPETLNNGKCVFPFVNENMCHDDCIDENDYWCSYTKGYIFSGVFSYCKYLRNFKKYEGNLTYGIYRISSNCSKDVFCGGTVVATNGTINTPIQITKNSNQFLINSWEILPQPNNSVIIRTPSQCASYAQTHWKYSTENRIILGELLKYNFNTRFILNPHPNIQGIYSLISITGKTLGSQSNIGYQVSSNTNESVLLESYPLPIYWKFELIQKLNMDVEEDPCGKATTASVSTTASVKQDVINQSNEKLEADITSVKITVYVTIAICSVMLIIIFVIIIIMCRNH